MDKVNKSKKSYMKPICLFFLGILMAEVALSSGIFEANAATTIIVNKTITITKSFNGNGVIYKHGPYLGDSPIMRVQGSGVTLSNVIFDDSNFRGTNGAVDLEGSGNTITGCTLNNCQRYGFIVSDGARNFKITNNVVTKAQYGISGSKYGNVVGGLIEGNRISGMILYGIKIKGMTGVTIRNNYIDCAPIYPGWDGTTTQYSKRGITTTDFDYGKSAVKNCIIEYNTIVQTVAFKSGTTMTSTGIYTDRDGGYNTGNIFRYNTVKNVVTGVWLVGNNYVVKGSSISYVKYKIKNSGYNNLIS